MFLRNLPFALVYGAALLGACQSPDAGAQADLSTTQPQQAAYQSAGTIAESSRVEVFDQGLRMVCGSYEVPAGWKLRQNVATDPQTGRTAQFVMDFQGPAGELITTLGVEFYSAAMAQQGGGVASSFDQAWEKLVRTQLSRRIHIRELSPAWLSSDQEVSNEVRRQFPNQRIELYERDVRGTTDGRAVEGKVLAMRVINDGGTGLVASSAVLTPPGGVDAAVAVSKAIDQSYRPNPRYEQQKAQLSQREMQRQQYRHQQRMATRQQMFDAHQQRMRGQQQANDQRHQQWMSDFRSDWSTNTGGGSYSTQDAHVDQIHEQSSFQDDWSGQQVQQDGQYDYWYTNGQGDYYGTDDANFNPATLPGNWQQTQPLRPNGNQ
ncbi:MAG: hypothetical protein WBA12_06345 [Catalinimonas sp.]